MAENEESTRRKFIVYVFILCAESEVLYPGE